MGNPIQTRPKSGKRTLEGVWDDYQKNGLDYEDALRLSQWDNPPTAAEYLANQSFYDNNLVFDLYTGKYTPQFQVLLDKGFSIGDASLATQVLERGNKIDYNNLMRIERLSDGRIIWLEKGSLGKRPAGWLHILDHESDFIKNGILKGDIEDFLFAALQDGSIVGYQGTGTGRPIYEVMWKGEKKKVAITVGSNGFIVGANPRLNN